MFVLFLYVRSSFIYFSDRCIIYTRVVSRVSVFRWQTWNKNLKKYCWISVLLSLYVCLFVCVFLQLKTNRVQCLLPYLLYSVIPGLSPQQNMSGLILRQDAGFGPFGYISNTYGHVMRFHSEFLIGFMILTTSACLWLDPPKRGGSVFLYAASSLCVYASCGGGGIKFLSSWVGRFLGGNWNFMKFLWGGTNPECHCEHVKLNST